MINNIWKSVFVSSFVLLSATNKDFKKFSVLSKVLGYVTIVEDKLKGHLNSWKPSGMPARYLL